MDRTVPLGNKKDTPENQQNEQNIFENDIPRIDLPSAAGLFLFGVLRRRIFRRGFPVPVLIPIAVVVSVVVITVSVIATTFATTTAVIVPPLIVVLIAHLGCLI